MMRMLWMAGGTLLVLLLAQVVRAERLSYQSDGKRILVDHYSPKIATGRTVVVLHGAGGLLFDGPRMRRVARSLASGGNDVYFVHYFDQTGTIAARDPEMQARFEQWLATVRAGIAWAHARTGGRPVGIYGYSLGAFLAVAASSDNPMVGAVTEQAGGVWNSNYQRIRRMPPVLMVHGKEDQRVPFAKYAQPLERLLRERGKRVETDFVEGEGHVFSEKAMQLVRPRVVEFFARALK